MSDHTPASDSTPDSVTDAALPPLSIPLRSRRGGYRRRPFSVDEYHILRREGILKPDEQLELIEGLILHQAPINERQAAATAALARILEAAAHDRYTVLVRRPVRLAKRSEPEPAVALLLPSTTRKPPSESRKANLALIIETGDGNLDYERQFKLKMYAATRVPEVWLLDAATRTIEVYRSPKGRRYLDQKIADSGDTIGPAGFHDIGIPVADVMMAIPPAPPPEPDTGEDAPSSAQVGSAGPGTEDPAQ